MSIEELGHRTIEGFDAIGWRITSQASVVEATAEATMQRIHETWCSEELGAILLSVDGGAEDGPRLQIALTQIQRTEPDPSLFDIPPDYTVSDTLQPPQPSSPPGSLSTHWSGAAHRAEPCLPWLASHLVCHNPRSLASRPGRWNVPGREPE